MRTHVLEKNMEKLTELKKNEIYTAEIDGYTSEALGVCHIGGRAVFVPKALAGEVWEIRIVKVTASAVYGKGEKLLQMSPERTESACPFFGRCGGCDTWHMSYEAELALKLQRVNDALERIGKQSVKAEAILGADRFTRYRNKGIMAVTQTDSGAKAGFFRERSHQLIEIDDCLIQSELCGRAARAVLSFLRKYNIPAYSEESGRGTVRHVYCRKAYYGSDAVLVLVSADGFGTKTGALVELLRRECPELSGIVLNINKTGGNTILDGDFYTLWGKSEISDTLCGLKFEISPRAFYQINPPQAERLYSKALEYAALTKDDLVLDLYCGAGTISLCLAGQAGRVVGAEIVPQAIENARENAANNNITNADFICADAGEAARMFAEQGLTPKVIVVDPPRKGMDPTAVEAAASMRPERIVYVSCDPATLARDILRFTENGYALQKATAVDMFPRTSHVETVVWMARVKE